VDILLVPIPADQHQIGIHIRLRIVLPDYRTLLEVCAFIKTGERTLPAQSSRFQRGEAAGYVFAEVGLETVLGRVLRGRTLVSQHVEERKVRLQFAVTFF
jgi:hypothetical protein